MTGWLGLMMGQALLRSHGLLFGLGVHAVDFAQGFEDIATLGGKILRHAHKLPPAMTQAKRQDRLEFRAEIARERMLSEISGLDKRTSIVLTVLTVLTPLTRGILMILTVNA